MTRHWRKWRRRLPGFLDRFRRDKSPVVEPWLPEDERIYCIGDIHGRADLLRQVHDLVLNDAAGYAGKITVVYLGDYIDRGDDSQQVIELLLQRPLPDFRSVYLIGNHEQALLDFIKNPDAAAGWLAVGGRETLISYGVLLAYIPTRHELPELAEQLDQRLPDSHRVFFQACSASWRCGSYYFVHAGIRPGVPLDKQTREDQLWIRNEFLSSNRNHEAIVVHGHSVYDQPQVLKNRISIDTGAYESGVLTCLVLQGSEQRFMQTGQGNVDDK